MDDVEQIIIQTLRTIDCEIDDSIKNLSHFSTELVVASVTQCLKTINPNVKISGTLPPTIPARFKLGTELTQFCKELGFKGDLSYATFLYGNAIELRNVFTFLLEKLPRVEDQAVAESSPDEFSHQIKKKVLQELNTPWLPQYCSSEKSYPFVRIHHYEARRSLVRPRETRGFSIDDFHIPRSEFIPAVIEKSDVELAAEKDSFQYPQCRAIAFKHSDRFRDFECDSRFALSAHLQYQEQQAVKQKPKLPPKPGSKVIVHEEKTGQDLVETLKEEVNQMQRICETKRDEAVTFQQEIEMLKRGNEELLRNKNAEEKELDKLDKIFLLLPESDSHIERLTTLLENNTSKFSDMQKQWTEFKEKLDAAYKATMESKAKSSSWKLKESVKHVREKLRETVLETEAKELLVQKLQDEIRSVPTTSIQRSFYTQRIMAVVASLRKQNEEMQKVLEDIKSIQREINSLQGKVDRTFIVTDEIIFKDAKTDETAKKIYKLLVRLHSECEDILKLTDEIAVTSREGRDLEEQVELQKRKNIGTSLKKITADLTIMQNENVSLESQLAHSDKNGDEQA